MFVVDESKIVNGTYKGVMQVFSYDNANEIELPWRGQFLVLLRNQFGALPVVDYFEGNRYKLNEAIYHYRGSNVLEFIKVGGTRKTMVLVPLSVQVSAYNMENDGIKGAYIPELEKEIQKVLEVIRNSGTNVTNKEKAFLNNLKFIEKELTDKTNVVFGKVAEVLNEVALVEQESERFLSLVRENELLVDEKVQDFTTDVATKQADVTSKYNAFDTSVTQANQTIDEILGLTDDVQQVSAQVSEKALKTEVGTLTSLLTTAKTSIVTAINELFNSKANKAQEAWITPTLLGSTMGDVQYRKNQFGRVEMRGKVIQETTHVGVFNLKVGYFDNITQRFIVVADDGTIGSLLQTGTLIFLSSNLANKNVSLNGVSFIKGM